MHPPSGDKETSQPGSQCKDKDDPKIVEETMKESFIMGHLIMGKGLHPTSKVPNAHGAGVLIRIDLTEGLNLHGTGKRNQGVRQKIQRLGEKANQKKKENFNN